MTNLKPMKSLLYWNPDSSLSYESQADKKRQFLAKYFPKCIKKISMDLKNGPLKSKIKRTKVIQELVFPPKLSHRSDWRVLLANKLKSLKKLASSDQNPYQFAQKIKIFSGLNSLSISLPRQSGRRQAVDQERYFKIAFKRMNRLRNLKSLVIRHLTKDQKDLLEKLDSFSRLLSSLTRLCITFSWANTCDPEFVNIILSKKNILNSVTSLILGVLCSPSHHTSFQNLTDSCPKLEHLLLGFSCRNLTYPKFEERRFAENTFPVEVNYLSALKTFHSLRSIHLMIADTYTCLKDLALPPLIQHLDLNFQECLSKEIMLKICPNLPHNSPEISHIFEENEIFIQFYEKFKCLGYLETFNIDFNLGTDPDAYRHQSYLLHSLLKRVPTLKSFMSGVSPPIRGLNKEWTHELRNPYLPQFFESCHSFGQTLQTLQIGRAKFIYSGFDLSASRNKFPQLSSIQIFGQFEQYQGFNPAILPLLEGFVSLGDSLTKIRIVLGMHNTVKTLLSLLQQISQLKMPAKLDIEIDVSFLNAFEDLKEGFEDVVNELETTEQKLWKAKRNLLKLWVHVRSKEMEKFLNVFGERFERFELYKLRIFD